MYLHKIQLEKPFQLQRLGNSLTWEVAYDGKTLTFSHKSGRVYAVKQKAPAFIGIDISEGKPRVFPVKKPKDPRRALLWEHGFRRRDEVESPPSYEEFEGQYCYLYDEKGRWTGGHAPHFVYRSEHLFIGYVREAVRYQGFQRQWWMSPDCSLEEVQEAVKGLGSLRRDYAAEGNGYK
jgi:hypothetical protein